MDSRAKIFLLVIVIASIAIGLAFAIRQKNLREIAMQQALTPPTPTTTQPVPIIMSRDYVGVDGVTTVHIDSTFIDSSGRVVFGDNIGFSGTSTAFENQISWSLVDASGTTITLGYIYVHSPDAGLPGPFEVHTALPTEKITFDNGELHVFEASAKDGTPTHVVIVPVTFNRILRP